MKKVHFLIVQMILGGIISSVPAVHAQEATLQVTLAGESYNGAPEFIVSFEDTVVGKGIVSDAIDTVTVGRLSQQDDWGPYSQKFTFTVPKDVLDPFGSFSFALTNDDWGGPGSNQDRNLYLLNAVIDGKLFNVKDFKLLVKGEAREVPADARGVPLNQNSAVAYAEPPEGGWPSAGQKEQNVAVEVDTTGTAETADAKTASTETKPANADAGCSVSRTVAVAGFRSSAAKMPSQIADLADLAASIGGQTCMITITGYSSTSGSQAFNEALAGKRAESVAAYLESAGVDMAKSDIVVGGETDQFGSRYSNNRRVIVDVTPN